MKLLKIFLICLLVSFTVSSYALASDFGWTRDFNIQAQADPSGFRARLATRFNLGDVQVKAVLSNFDSPADAFIMLRLGEMAGLPMDDVIDKYKRDKGKGWGVLAKNLGIKPGSAEFHALKQGHDLFISNQQGKSHGSDSYHGKANNIETNHGKSKVKKKGTGGK